MAVVFENRGFCPTCNQEVTFFASNNWFRDYYCCPNCNSIPRERALMVTLEMFYPNWRDLIIHESSPALRGASKRIASECQKYIPTYYYPDVPLGSLHDGYRCENLEKLTFDDCSVDIHITQDVFEHIFDPSKAFHEIARTMRLGGAHIFTVPLVNKNRPSVVRAKRTQNGDITYILDPVYHGNPISNDGSLVTVDWGYDICDFIYKETGLFTQMIYIDDISRGIRAEYIEVLITRSIGEIYD